MLIVLYNILKQTMQIRFSCEICSSFSNHSILLIVVMSLIRQVFCFVFVFFS